MQVKKFEYEKVIVYVEYNQLPKKEDIKESCIRFLKKAMQEREGKEKNEK
jgi:hypothetical protein